MTFPWKTELAAGALGFALLLFSPPTLASRLPTAEDVLPQDALNSKKQICGGKDDCAYMPQNDAFDSAAEQAAFLGVYQMSFGPYGKVQNSAEREKLIQETAVAIDDCIKGVACTTAKQEKVLKALVNYNLGQDIRRIMLTNTTNKDRMRSHDSNLRGDDGKLLLNQDAIQRSLASGKTFTTTNSPAERQARANRGEAFQTKSGGASRLTRRYGTGKEEEYFQLKEETVRAGIDPKYLHEREILGDKFLKDYSIFLDNYTSQGKNDKARYYKFIAARESYVFDESKDGFKINEQRLTEIQQDLENKNIKQAVVDFKKTLKPIVGIETDKGQAKGDTRGVRFDALGLGPQVLPADQKIDGIDIENLKKDGKFDELASARAATRFVNKKFQEAADTAKLRKEQSRGPLRGPATAAEPKTYISAVLSPDTFGNFLDEIWPTKAKREAIVRGASGISGGRNP